MTPDVGAPRRIRNPGRRGYAAETYRFAPRIPLEVQFLNDPEYRQLRYAADTADRKLTLLTAARAPDTRLQAAAVRSQTAAAQCAQYLLRHLPAEEPEVPVVLSRTMDAEGSVVGETETAVPTLVLPGVETDQ